MARIIKIPNEHLKRFAWEEQKRKKDVRNKRKNYLIVCEGEATEPTADIVDIQTELNLVWKVYSSCTQIKQTTKS